MTDHLCDGFKILIEICKKVIPHLGGISDHPGEIVESLYITNDEEIVSFYQREILKSKNLTK